MCIYTLPPSHPHTLPLSHPPSLTPSLTPPHPHTLPHTLTPSHSPVIIADDANISVAGRRIMWGKCLNAGQTCIAPDYVICPSGKRDKLVAAMKSALNEFFGEVRFITLMSSFCSF